jgi:hypothetical protein
MRQIRQPETATALQSRAARSLRATTFAVLAAWMLMALAGCQTNTIPASSGGIQAPGTIELNQQTSTDDALFGGGGNGTISFNGTVYRFAIGGLGTDGSAVAILATTGEVYQLGSIGQFAGTYRQASDSAPRPSQDSSGLWIQNEHGVLMHIRPPPQGRIPVLRGDGLRVVLDL